MAFAQPMPGMGGGGVFHGQGEIHDGHHGDPNRHHSFWVYGPMHQLVTLRWDTHLAPE